MKLIIALLVSIATTFALPTGTYENISVQDVENRIVGGTPAQPGQFPYQVGIRMYKVLPGFGRMNWWCGSSLIATNTILTAANCVKGAEIIEVFIGVTNLAKDESSRQVFTVNQDQVILHEQYDGARAKNDIALIKLPENVALNNYVQTVNLPKRSQKSESFERTVGWVSGWGMLGFFKKFPEELQYAQRWILSPDACEKHFTIFDKETQLCIDGSNKVSTCSGDGGNPLVIVEADNSKTLVGITSYGSPNGCESGNPSGYTRVTAFLDWIAQHTGIAIRD